MKKFTFLCLFCFVFAGSAYAADLRFDPDGDGVDEFVVKEEGGVSVGEYSLPAADGSSGQVLATDGAGDVSWVSASGNGDSVWLEKPNNVVSDKSIVVGSDSVVMSSGDGYLWTIEGKQIQHFLLNDNNTTNFVIDEYGLATGILYAADSTADVSTSGIINQGFILDGVDDYIGTAHRLTPGSDFAASFWFTSATAGQESILLWGTLTSSTGGRFYFGYDGGARFAVGFGPNLVYSRSGCAAYVLDDQPHWYYVEYDAEEIRMRVYVDNILIADNISESLGEASPVFSLGALNFGDQRQYFCNGLFDDYRFYQTHLTEQERIGIFNYGAGTEVDFRYNNQEVLVSTSAVTGSDYVSPNIKNNSLENFVVEGDFENLGSTYHEGDVFIGGDVTVEGDYRTADGSQGYTGTCPAGSDIVVKNGIIVSCSNE